MITYYFILFAFCFTQDIYTDYLVLENDTIDVFSYQIPENYDSEIQHPLLVTFHQWGGNENSNYYTGFDEEANNRNWIMLSPYGGSSNNYNHQQAQNMFKEEIKWMMQNFNIDSQRIYMVGGSMGGASGAIYANNHLNPTEPMVAATASASGILDCERRAIEMDGNNSMIEWFGGNWDEFPFEYHRNSAVYFNDTSQSMHYNLQHVPLYLDFGTTESHRTHAEDLYNLLYNYNNNIWIDTDPTGSHGYSVFDENHVCNWLEQFELIDNPGSIHVNLDEPSRAYWVEAKNQIDTLDFININILKTESELNIIELNNSDSLILHILNDSTLDYNLNLNTEINNLGITGEQIENINDNLIEFNGALIESGMPLTYNLDNNIIWIKNCYPMPNDCIEDSLGSIQSGIYDLQIQINHINNDINQDGTLNIIDIMLVMNYILDDVELNIEQEQNADINNDNIINIIDIIEMVNLIINNGME